MLNGLDFFDREMKRRRTGAGWNQLRGTRRRVGEGRPTMLGFLSNSCRRGSNRSRPLFGLLHFSYPIAQLPAKDVPVEKAVRYFGSNLYRIRELGDPIASIGGAGISDGVVLTGIIAVLPA
jgi:hypothetical protein